MSATPNTFANLGAEEGEAWRDLARTPEVRAAAALFESLLDPPRPFRWLEVPDALYAWLGTEEAARVADERGLQLAGAAPEVVSAVHDKAFAHRVALREGLHPAELAGLPVAFDASELADAEASLERLSAVVAGWPAWTGGRFTLKPRQGSSGRGRIGGTLEGLDRPALAGALPRLAARGGAMLEPWLQRTRDVSAQLHIGEDRSITLLGTSTLLVAGSGRYRGQRGSIDSRGRVTSASSHDEALREAAVAVAAAAAERGLRGPCGVDGFSFRVGERELFRPVVELNARFTMGIVAIGLLRRALPRLKAELGLAPGMLLAFQFAAEPPAGGWPACPEDCLLVDLAAPGAAFFVAPSFERLDELLGGP